MKTEVYHIGGMSCASCSAAVTRVVSRLDGVQSCDVNLITEKMTVTYEPKKANEKAIVSAVVRAGFAAERLTEDDLLTEREPRSAVPVALIYSAVLSVLLLYVSMGQMWFPALPVPSFASMHQNPLMFAVTQLILTVPILFFGRRFFFKGVPALFKGHPSMDTLVALGSGASFCYSVVMTLRIPTDAHAVHSLYYESAAVVLTLILLGKYFEQKSKRQTAAAIRKLMRLAPDTVTVLRDGQAIEIPTVQAQKGELMLLAAGSRIPLDGIVTAGSGSVDESMLTGESLPLFKAVGDTVTGGSLNQNGAFTVEITRVGKDTTLAKIIHFVEEAQGKKAPIAKTADKIAGIFVPVVLGIALLAAAVFLACGFDFSFALRIFTDVLVIACPCSLGLATPTAIMVGTGLGANHGILIRNGEALETAQKTAVAVFDKTGTLTNGTPAVTDCIANDPDLLLKTAATAERLSEHPLAVAVTAYAEKHLPDLPPAVPSTTVGGKGLTAQVDGQAVLIGSERFLRENGLSPEAFSADAERLNRAGKTVIFVARGQTVLGLLAVTDQLKPTAKKAISALKEMGIRTVLLSGDRQAVAEAVGETLGTDRVFGEILPEGKAEILAKLKQEYGTVMMVGDGINDTPALATADIGCAIGNGSDIAIESADIVLMKSDPVDVARAVRLSRLTLRNIRQNLFWAFCYNTVCIPIAAGVLYPAFGLLLNPMLAGFAMSMSSLFVVGNALRLNTKKIDIGEKS